MTEGGTKLEFRRCFVSGPQGHVTAAIAEMLAERGIETFTASSINAGSAINEEVLRMIAAVDFVAVVLTERDSTNVIYELGVARGLNKPALVFSIGQSMPSDLQGIYRTIIAPERIGEVAVDIDRFLRNAKRPQPVADDTLRAPKQDLTWAREELKLQRSPNYPGRAESFEALVGRVLEVTGVEVQYTSGAGGDNGVDLIAWLNDVAYVLGGPILIQCKVLGGSSGSVIKNTEAYVNRLNRTLSMSDARLALFIFDQDRPRALPTLFPTPNVVPFSIDDLIDSLEQGVFEQEVIRRRRRATMVQGSSP